MKLLERIEKLSQIGLTEAGISRVSGSIADQEARNLVVGWMMETGMSVRQDEHKNIIGRLEGIGDPIVVGSHIDTVATAGKYDGVLGVLAGIEAANRLQHTLRSPLEVCIFTDEETTMSGSIGYTARQPNLKAFLELHVEQGPILDCQQKDIGIVQGIVGQRRSELTVYGQENHAGTTPMSMRDDALVRASRIVQHVYDKAFSWDGLTATIGKLDVSPNAFSVVPGRVDFTLQCRDLDAGKMDKFVEEVCAHFDIVPNIVYTSEPALCDQSIQDMIESSCNARGLRSMHLPSRASHDAQNFTFCPMGMIFVPSVGGISHSPKEFTTDEQCHNGTDILVDTILQIDARTTTS